MELPHTDSTQSSNPILRLPQEIKDKIYGLAVGGQVICVTQSLPGCDQCLSSFNIICQFCRSFEVVQTTTGTEARHPWKEPITGQLRTMCRPGNEALSLGLLRTCHQIYQETRYLPYSSNTFAFHRPEVLKDFVNHLVSTGRHNELAIRSLHLNVTPRTMEEARLWKDHALPSMAKAFANIEHLHFVSELGIPFRMSKAVWGCRGKAALLELTNLCLKQIAFTIYDEEGQCYGYHIPFFRRDPASKSVDEKRDWLLDAIEVLVEKAVSRTKEVDYR